MAICYHFNFQVRKLCTNLLPNYAAQKFVLVTLNALTQLAAAATIDIPDQISLLLQYLNTDPRHSVKKLVLMNLKSLAEKGAHMWSENDILVTTYCIMLVSLTVSNIIK